MRRSRVQNLVAVLLAIFALNSPVLAVPAPQSASPDAGPATAEEAGEPKEQISEAIVVTARRREESLQKVPISVTALNTTQLEARSLNNLTDLNSFVPNLSFNVSGGFGDESAEANIFMRGVGQLQEQRFVTDAGVGIYVDGVFVARSHGAVFDLLDLERVEVLRGPQGTLFGRNAIGGAISLVTRRPTSDFQARLTGTVGDYNRADLNASISGGLGENLNAGLSAISANRDGFSRSLTTGQEFGDINYDAARLALDWQAAPNVSVHVTSDFTAKREAGSNMLLLDIDASNPINDFFTRAMAAAGRPGLTEEWETDSIFRSYSDFLSRVNSDVYGASASVAWAWSDITLQSITAYRGFEIDSAGDLDGTPADFANRQRLHTQDQLSQEFQLSGLAMDNRMTWQTGVLYFREEPFTDGLGLVFPSLYDALESLPGATISPPGAPAFLCDPGPPPPGVPCWGGAGNPLNFAFLPIFLGDVIDQRTVSTAAFAEATWDVGDRGELTAGLRYSKDDKEITLAVYDSLTTPNLADGRSDQGSWSAWTPRLSYAHQAKDNLMLYASASRGFKSGGFDIAAFEIDNRGFGSFRPEFMWSYEAGLKSNLFDNRLRLNWGAFFSDYKDIQFIVLDVLGGGIVPTPVIRNAGTAEILGSEIELEATLSSGLVLNAGAGWIDSELVEVDPTAGIEPTASFPKTPDWNYNLGLQYAFELGGGSTIARADYGWKDDFYHDFFNTAPSFQPGYGLLNARVSWAPVSDRWDIAVFGTNLTGEEYSEAIIFFEDSGVTLGVAGRPREWGAALNLRW